MYLPTVLLCTYVGNLFIYLKISWPQFLTFSEFDFFELFNIIRVFIIMAYNMIIAVNDWTQTVLRLLKNVPQLSECYNPRPVLNLVFIIQYQYIYQFCMSITWLPVRVQLTLMSHNNVTEFNKRTLKTREST